MIWHLPGSCPPHEYSTAQRPDDAYRAHQSRRSSANLNHTTRRGTNDDLPTATASRISGRSVPTSNARFIDLHPWSRKSHQRYSCPHLQPHLHLRLYLYPCPRLQHNSQRISPFLLLPLSRHTVDAPHLRADLPMSRAPTRPCQGFQIHSYHRISSQCQVGTACVARPPIPHLLAKQLCRLGATKIKNHLCVPRSPLMFSRGWLTLLLLVSPPSISSPEIRSAHDCILPFLRQRPPRSRTPGTGN
jgi:hypothetical protein